MLISLYRQTARWAAVLAISCFCHISVISILDVGRQVANLILFSVKVLNVDTRHAPFGIVVQPQFYRGDLRVLAQKFLQGQWLLARGRDPAQRQTVFVRSIAAERHLGHGIYGGFKHRHGSAGLHWRDAESVLFLTAGSLPLERFPIVINTAQSSIFRHTLRVFAQENTVVIFCTFVQNFSLNTVPDGGQ